MRSAFSAALTRLGQRDPNVLLLTGDHGYALFDEFRKGCPSQFINAGIAEQNMVGMAAGLARVGFRPFVYGLSAFVPIRVIEQIKMDIAHDDLPVVLLGDGAGFVYSHLGPSHQSAEDIACARSVPGLTVLSPGDRFEMTACMDLAYDLARPVYLRMGKADRGDVHDGALPALTVGEPVQIRAGSPDAPALIATGSMVTTADQLAAERGGMAVWSVPSIKPLSAEAITAIARSSHGLIVLEEHSVHGGLGAAVTEIVSETAPCRVLRIGIRDRFSEHCGSYDYLLREHGLDLVGIKERMDAFFATA
jgi:transketolase